MQGAARFPGRAAGSENSAWLATGQTGTRADCWNMRAMERKQSATTGSARRRELPRTFASAEDQSPWRRRFEVIYLALRQRITTLEYAPGARLDIDLLSNEFGVSRTPVRNVLQRLDLESLVRTRHGVGTIVAALDLEDFRQAARLRIELASLIGKFPATGIAASALESLTRVSGDVALLADTRDAIVFARIDMQVHDVIGTVVGNALMRRCSTRCIFEPPGSVSTFSRSRRGTMRYPCLPRTWNCFAMRWYGTTWTGSALWLATPSRTPSRACNPSWKGLIPGRFNP